MCSALGSLLQLPSSSNCSRGLKETAIAIVLPLNVDLPQTGDLPDNADENHHCCEGKSSSVYSEVELSIGPEVLWDHGSGGRCLNAENVSRAADENVMRTPERSDMLQTRGARQHSIKLSSRKRGILEADAVQRLIDDNQVDSGHDREGKIGHSVGDSVCEDYSCNADSGAINCGGDCEINLPVATLDCAKVNSSYGENEVDNRCEELITPPASEGAPGPGGCNSRILCGMLHQDHSNNGTGNEAAAAHEEQPDSLALGPKLIIRVGMSGAGSVNTGNGAPALSDSINPFSSLKEKVEASAQERGVGLFSQHSDSSSVFAS